jgi:hypothetical protein
LITTDTNTATTVYDTVMTVYTASGNCSGFTEVECNDTVEGRASITRSLTSGVNYYIVVWDADPASPIPGESLVQVRVASVAKPTVTTGPISNLSSTNATGVASVNPNSGLTRAWFEWGPTTSYGTKTTSRVVGSGSTALAFSDPLTGLTPGTLYHYRAVATNVLGSTFGNDVTFRWTGAQPRITTYSRLANGSYRIQFTATAGQLYKVESANVLGSWSELGTATELGNNLFEFVDTLAPSAQTRFYRVKAP